jgi:Domain of unknown function (DUF1707)
MAGPRDEIAAAAGGHGHLLASHADREQVIGTLKAAFVQGRLAKDEFSLRAGQALAARTCAELAALTADLPAGLAAAPPPPSTWAPGEPRIPRAGLVLTVATVVYATALAVVFVLPANGEGEPPGGAALVVTATLFYLLLLLMVGTPILADRLNERSTRQRPRRPGPGAGGQASPRLPPGGPGGQLPPAGHGHRHTADAVRRRLPRLPLAGSRSLHRCRPPGGTAPAN